MAALPQTRVRPWPALVTCALAAAFLATRVALIWRFPWFVDETTFASYARDVHSSISNFFVAEQDKKGLLPSWLGAGLIEAGIAPVTAMRLLAAAGTAVAAICGGLVMRRFYGLREALVSAGLIALGPFFLVTGSVGIYDAMVTGLVAAAVLVSISLAIRPRLETALLLGAIIGAGGLTKPNAWVAAAVLPVTLLLFDFAPADRRRRLLDWAGYAGLALAVGYALTSIARFSPLYEKPIVVENHRGLSQVLDAIGLAALTNGWDIFVGLVGYLTPPGVLLALLGASVAWRRHRPAAAILMVWALTVIVSAVLLPLWGNPRYFAAAIVPLAGFVALGALALWDYILLTWRRRESLARVVACSAAVLALAPAALFDTHVLAHPTRAQYPGLDEKQYVTRPSALAPLASVARTIARGGGPYPVWIDAGPYPRRIDVGPWGLDLWLNGDTVGRAADYRVFFHGTPTQLAKARYIVSDGDPSPVPPRRGYHLIEQVRRSDGGAVMRLYERDGPEPPPEASIG